MTIDLKDVMAFLIGNYPKKVSGELSNARLTKMVYLADWHFALNQRQLMTGIEWYFDTYGPFVKDIEKTAAQYDNIFVTDFGNNLFGTPKKTFSLRNPNQKTKLGEKEEASLKHIIKVTSDLSWRDFINLVYSTYPVRASERYSYLNLPELADEYKKLQKQNA